MTPRQIEVLKADSQRLLELLNKNDINQAEIKAAAADIYVVANHPNFED